MILIGEKPPPLLQAVSNPICANFLNNHHLNLNRAKWSMENLRIGMSAIIPTLILFSTFSTMLPVFPLEVFRLESMGQLSSLIHLNSLSASVALVRPKSQR
jgi:hypothetical protein